MMRYLLSLCLLLTYSLHSLAQVSWGNSHTRYKHQVLSPLPQQDTLHLQGWRGEMLNAQALVQNSKHSEELYQLRLTKLVGRKTKQTLKLQKYELGYVDEVLADTFSACGLHDVERYGRFKEADRIVLKPQFLLPHGEQRGVWLSLYTSPANPSDSYRGTLEVLRSGKLLKRLHLVVDLVDEQLPQPKDWRFHLDFWQNPYAVARWHGVELWSDAHFAALRPYMERLAQSGQKVITATLIDRPWDGQTQDPFGSMIVWHKGKDSTWYYDYSRFDRWVSFMMDCGINREITCFSMIPWRLSFAYHDDASHSTQEWQSKPGEELYRERWGHFLSDFSRHLAERGWLDKTTIAMDERSLEQMQAAIGIIKSYAPGIKISMAGHYHPEIEAELSDYCVDLMSPTQYSPEVLERRRSEGKISTYYTCCSSPRLNTFTFSPLTDALFIPWYALKKGYDGYLRWAYNSWTIDPIYDSRFRAWSSGDTYIVYPENMPSLRWQKLVEGIQQFEKYHLLKRRASDRRDAPLQQGLSRLMEAIDLSRLSNLGTLPDSLRQELNRLH